MIDEDCVSDTQHDYAHDLAGRIQELFEDFRTEHEDVDVSALYLSLNIVQHAWHRFLNTQGVAHDTMLATSIAAVSCSMKLFEYLQNNGDVFMHLDKLLRDMPKQNVPGGDA